MGIGPKVLIGSINGEFVKYLHGNNEDNSWK